MARRVRLPGADELFRTTATGAVLRAAGEAVRAPRAEERLRAVPSPERDDACERDDSAATPSRPELAGVADAEESPRTRRPTGRQRHDEKITVYISQEELLDLERARILLRARYGVAVDRGRIVREAIAMTLADLDEREFDSALLRRLLDS